MYKPVGVDPQTGYTIFKDERGRYLTTLNKCPCCGEENKMSGDRGIAGQTVCVDCSAKYFTYICARNRLNSRRTYTTMSNHKKRLEYWIDIDKRGGVVPEDIYKEYEEVCSYLAYQDSLKPPEKEKHEVHCPYCGKPAMAHKGATKSQQRCDECERRYKRYRWLQQNLGALTYKQLVEFNDILDEYVVLMRKGWWAPDIPKYREKIRKRLEVVEEDA